MPLLQGTSGSGDAAWVTTLTDSLTVSGLLTLTGGLIQNRSAPLAAITALTAAASGTLFTCAQGGAPITITLPPTATSAGVEYTFLLGTATAQDFIVTADGAVMLGALVEGGAAVVAVAHTSIAFDGNTAVIGDHFSVRCNGTNWSVTGIGSNANSWILA
jgi:hypothetical protein